ncbi:hypothetical protein [Hymenobacter negativus]|uniref:DUF5103 domain-containing protein n=1 Tax=Hymenobacter negativus TaxID=2795026 RepID=A0ABS3QNV2_9BACT|nr:hypothetical protein [Hymenobacter negativus]MBO2012957.1 hypothetical protein [Hymenobacter negativus]
MPPTRWLLAAALLLSACRPHASQEQETPPRLKPLFDALPARNRPFDRQDTLDSYWPPDSLMADSLFHFTAPPRSRVLMRVQFVPASAVAAARLDTLTFRRPTFRLYEDGRSGYEWEFFFGRNLEPTLTETPEQLPLRMALTYSHRLALQEYRRWPAGNYYERNAYLLDHNFGVEAVACVNDSVVYVSAFPLLANQPRPDTLYTYYHGGPHRKRPPLVADRPDTTRHALLRLSFRELSHSTNLE